MSGEDAYVKMDDFQESFKVYFEDRRDSVNEAPQQGGEENYVDFNPGENEYLKPLSVRLPVQKWPLLIFWRNKSKIDTYHCFLFVYYVAGV